MPSEFSENQPAHRRGALARIQYYCTVAEYNRAIENLDLGSAVMRTTLRGRAIRHGALPSELKRLPQCPFGGGAALEQEPGAAA